ncbi:MAG: hypothetical protein M1414_04210 [Candidatus Thermoplasmatota archaeon]|jgi:hypothetical protein|nr:hypothetical protein [Candidatus Thermoplasmatota archaeon]MCL5988089.1 hypothetical protein [Candidatus Thermoplasmatota archaeon]
MVADNSPDIRGTVEDNRGLLKKIQIIVPGFSGYREKEDLRAADELLRSQVSGIFSEVLSSLDSMRQQLSICFKTANLMALASTISTLQTIQGDILHAQQGYSGISPSIRINDHSLDKIYEFDYGFVKSGKEMKDSISSAGDACSMGDQILSELLSKIRVSATQCRNSWSQRMNEIENIKVS